MSASDSAVAANFDRTAVDYDEVVRHNIHGANRLVSSIPDGDYRDLLDVGCGTGHASLAMVERFGIERVTGIDPAAGMLDVFREKLGAHDGLDVKLHEADVMSMPVPDESVDVAISTMAFHWFPRKRAATAAIARALRPGGVVAILCSGRRGEEEFKRVLAQVEPPVPAAWIGTFDLVQRDEREIESYLRSAGLEPIDIWMESRVRRTPVFAYLERMRVVAGHLNAGMDPDTLADLQQRVFAATEEAAGPDGFEYTFSKLFALARKP
jgi:ubiquinone/menaquinone biosynthesis C-methylase UbiE